MKTRDFSRGTTPARQAPLAAGGHCHYKLLEFAKELEHLPAVGISVGEVASIALGPSRDTLSGVSGRLEYVVSHKSGMRGLSQYESQKAEPLAKVVYVVSVVSP